MTGFRYSRGDAATAVHGQSAVMTLGPPDLVVDLWRIIAGDDWTPLELLDRLTRDGLAATPSFAAVVVRGSHAAVLVRGSCLADITEASGTRVVSGTAVSTWTEVSVPWSDGTRVALRAGEGASVDPGWPILSGVVAAGSVVLGSASVGSSSSADLAAERAVEKRPVDLPPVPLPDGESVSQPEQGRLAQDDPGELDVAEPALRVDSSAHEAHLPAVPPPPATIDEAAAPGHLSDPNETLLETDDARFDAMFGATVAGRRLEDAAVRAIAAPEQPDDSASVPVASPPPANPESTTTPGDHGGDTMSAAELARLRAERRGGSPAPVPTRPPTVSATLELSTGQRYELDRPVVLGRSPRAHGASSAQFPRVVTIDNPYISGTHLVVSVEDGVVVATDQSTNGTLLTRPGAAPVRLDKGQATVVADGDVLALSDDVAATVRISGGGAS